MVLSMTGYGKAYHESEALEIMVELKTLNSKYADINLKLPNQLSEKEHEVRNLLKEGLERGKINCTIDLTEKSPEKTDLAINESLFKAYFQLMDSLADDVQADKSELFKLALQAPEVMKQNGGEEVSGTLWEMVRNMVNEAIYQCRQFRQQEGENILNYLYNYNHNIGNRLEKIKEQVGKRNDKVKERLQTQLKELMDPDQYDSNRFEQELIYYIEKYDINEETVRLKNHIDYFQEVLNDANSQGKKLGFIAQEMGREINTIGSKANDALIQREVVTMKEELEKIKEQLLNII